MRSPETIPDVLPGIQLTQQQWQALQELEEFVESGRKLHLLTGYAGTGKTVLLQALIKRMRERDEEEAKAKASKKSKKSQKKQSQKKRAIVLTAFSNKATKVLEQMSVQWGLEIDCMTCCKLLGLKPDIDQTTGKQVFKPDRNAENHFDKYQLVVVDEASMISEEMWVLLIQAVNNLHKLTQILFVGDVAQLPPINEQESLVFSQIYDRSELTEVVRYGGAIAVLAESIRDNLLDTNIPKFQTETNGDRTEGVIVTYGQEWEKLMIRAFQSKSYLADPDYVRAVAYTNARVNQLNQKIRAAIYGSDRPRFVPGERLVANAPYMNYDNLVLQNSSECEVLDIDVSKEENWHIWILRVLTDEGRQRDIKVLHELSQMDFEQKLDALAQEKRWQEFWDLRNRFADLSYAYCLTIHKSQGSTFQNVFVDVRNALVNRNIRERNQLLYVAVTRSAKRLFVSR